MLCGVSIGNYTYSQTSLKRDARIQTMEGGERDTNKHTGPYMGTLNIYDTNTNCQGRHQMKETSTSYGNSPSGAIIGVILYLLRISFKKYLL
mmetsp:Transcript_20853/g.24822  ORF Transcript_20853/g.24822 Transcript_20853/m.24822 type:complete len:92 (-) Transcript_20853:313-588(-)